MTFNRTLTALNEAEKGAYLVFGNTYCYRKVDSGESRWITCQTSQRGRLERPFFVMGLMDAAGHLGVPWSIS